MKEKIKIHSNDFYTRIGAGVFIVLGAALSMWFAIYGFPDFNFFQSNNSVPSTQDQGILKEVDLSILELEIMDTEPARRQGLSGRDNLDKNAGMLFVFPSSDRYPFWMIGMNFPIDIIWISDHIVVDVVTLSPPYPSFPIPPSHIPKKSADLVLELNAGRAAELGIKEGVRVSF